MLYRVNNYSGQFVANITAPHGDHAAVVTALANMFGGAFSRCIRRAYVQPVKGPRLVVTPMKKDGGPLVRNGRAVIFTAILIHDGEHK